MGRPVAPVPLDLLLRIAIDAELVVILHVVGDGDRPFPDNGVVPTAVVAACRRDVAVLALRYGRVPLVVFVVIVGRESRVWQVRIRVSSAPGFVLL